MRQCGKSFILKTETKFHSNSSLTNDIIWNVTHRTDKPCAGYWSDQTGCTLFTEGYKKQTTGEQVGLQTAIVFADEQLLIPMLHTHSRKYRHD